MKKLYLASQSPRRAQILSQIGLAFTVVSADAQEFPILPGEDIDARLAQLACLKAMAARDQVEDGFILGADTIVCLEDRVLGKPKDRAHAREMIAALAGRSHQVKTGVCICDAKTGRHVQGVATTLVHFALMDESDIEFYVSSGEGDDKAGAYACQGLGARYIEGIHGCFYNVMGLPPRLTLDLLRQAELCCND